MYARLMVKSCSRMKEWSNSFNLKGLSAVHKMQIKTLHNEKKTN